MDIVANQLKVPNILLNVMTNQDNGALGLLVFLVISGLSWFREWVLEAARNYLRSILLTDEFACTVIQSEFFLSPSPVFKMVRDIALPKHESVGTSSYKLCIVEVFVLLNSEVTSPDGLQPVTAIVAWNHPLQIIGV